MLGADHERTIHSVDALARVLRALKEYAEAEQLHRGAVAGLQRLKGPAYPSTLRFRGNLCVTLEDQGKLAEVEPMYRQLLADCERALGPTAHDTLVTVHRLGVVIDRRGRLAQALPLYERSARGMAERAGKEDNLARAFAARWSLTLAKLRDMPEALRPP